MPKNYLVTETVMVDRGDPHDQLTAGALVSEQDVPPGSLEQLVRIGQLVEPPAEGVSVKDAVDSGDKEVAPIALDGMGLPKTIVEKIKTLGLATRDDVADYAEKNSGFGDLLTDSQSEKVAEALKSTK